MEQGISIQIGTWEALLQAVLILLLLIIVSAGLGYNYGRRKATLWQNAMSHIPTGIVIFDSNRKIFFKNGPGTVLLKELSFDMIDRVRQVRTQTEPYAAEVRGLEGSQVNVQAWALGKKGASGVFLLLRNLTQEQVQAKRVQQSDRKYISRVSHEMLSPLTTMSSFLTAAGNDKLPTGERNTKLQKARKLVDDLIEKVSHLHIYSLLDSGRPIQPLRPFKITEVANEIVEQLSEQAEVRRISLAVEADPNLPPVEIDVGAWREVFRNLVGNGIKYGNLGGTVRIELRKKVKELNISIVDDGPGIPPGDLSRLFEEGERGASTGDVEGMGLGLTIVRLAVERHGGEIYPESEPGRGTTFHIILPFKQKS